MRDQKSRKFQSLIPYSTYQLCLTIYLTIINNSGNKFITLIIYLSDEELIIRVRFTGAIFSVIAVIVGGCWWCGEGFAVEGCGRWDSIGAINENLHVNILTSPQILRLLLAFPIQMGAALLSHFVLATSRLTAMSNKLQSYRLDY